MPKKNIKNSKENIEKVELFSLAQDKFLDYSVDVIKDRAIPDVRDGLKPVQRRILYAQSELKNYSGSQYKKSARVVGDIIGKYHPHGDTSVYEAMVNMAQGFSNNVPLVDGHGNFGSLDGDSAAAMRYTEVRMSKDAMHMIDGLKYNVVDYTNNYDDSEVEPVILPAKIPYLLLNGISGIAIGMSTNILPHNPKEILEATIHLLGNENARLSTLTKIVQGPDFVYPGKIINANEIGSLYKNGSLDKSLIFQSHYFLEEEKSIRRIVFDSVPYNVKKSTIMAELVNGQNVRKVGKKVVNPVFSFKDVRDESFADEIRIVIEVDKKTNIENLIQLIYKNTSLQKTYSSNMLVIADGVPQTLGLKEILAHYIEHQVNVYTREFNYKLDQVLHKLNIKEGLLIITADIDKVISIVRKSENKKSAKEKLIKTFKLNETQADYILDVKLGSLTKNDKIELEKEIKELNAEKDRLNSILKDDNSVKKEIIKYLKSVAKLIPAQRNVILTNEDVVGSNSVKMDKEIYFIQNEKGLVKAYEPKSDIKTLDTDNLQFFIKTNMKDTVRLFTDKGMMYNLEMDKVPQLSFKSSGYQLEDFVAIKANESVIQALVEENGKEYLFITKGGYMKLVDSQEFNSVSAKKVKATNLNADDEIIFIQDVDMMAGGPETRSVTLVSETGSKVKIKISDVAKMGKNSKGKHLGKFKKGKYVVEVKQ